MIWQPGDQVRIWLPDRTRPRGSGFRSAWFTGTVREVDPPGLPPGVRVDLDEPVNGVQDCYATHTELNQESGSQHPDWAVQDQ
jgi:hypothetical protein